MALAAIGCFMGLICCPGCGPTSITALDANRITVNVSLTIEPGAVRIEPGAIVLNAPINADPNVFVNIPVIINIPPLFKGRAEDANQ
jgi:hypothetical protein